ncbi:hypothetical protein OKW76_14530 [Sphingomonas sp. S1-29]|uniref:hypothetical protein n=1 Tax=Sphingomonas sp. S1-29 TaxID=2991074 RepID=UPI002240C7C6|nr:hypothetical protein [Sphingomonas sp. S1-29]UZK69218.1 hypothetical protein OKW76_14530 [Sphingomonas sp. S1-29]
MLAAQKGVELSMQIDYNVLAWHGADVRSRLGDRYGASLAERAGVFDGFDENSSLVEALVSAAVSHMLGQIASDSTSMLADGLEFRIEQTFFPDVVPGLISQGGCFKVAPWAW